MFTLIGTVFILATSQDVLMPGSDNLEESVVSSSGGLEMDIGVEKQRTLFHHKGHGHKCKGKKCKHELHPCDDKGVCNTDDEYQHSVGSGFISGKTLDPCVARGDCEYGDDEYQHSVGSGFISGKTLDPCVARGDCEYGDDEYQHSVGSGFISGKTLDPCVARGDCEYGDGYQQGVNSRFGDESSPRMLDGSNEVQERKRKREDKREERKKQNEQRDTERKRKQAEEKHKREDLTRQKKEQVDTGVERKRKRESEVNGMGYANNKIVRRPKTDHDKIDPQIRKQAKSQRVKKSEHSLTIDQSKGYVNATPVPDEFLSTK